ncbi:MAG: hypothetical protein AAFN77_20410 [Planctomycetota bacterium]
MSFNSRQFTWQSIGFAIAIMLGIGVIAGVGAYVGTKVAQPQPQIDLPLQLNAATGARSKSLSMATGSIDGDVEGLWILDHVTGNLQCWVLNARTGGVGAIYSTNVAGDLATGKAGDSELMMVTGVFLWDGGKLGNARPGQSICYVADSKTGNVVGYGFAFNNQAKKQGAIQYGPLQLICSGKARTGSVERDQ